jgi:uncharacterized cupin superfamily protein
MAPVGDALGAAAAQHRPTMIVLHHHLLPDEGPAPARRLHVAGLATGQPSFDVWLQWLGPGDASLPGHLDGEQALIVLRGFGKLLLDGAPQRFAGPCTLFVPAGCEHHLVNTGAEDLQIVVVVARGSSPQPA